MAVLVTTDVEGQTQIGYDSMLEKIKPGLTIAKGLISHASYRISGAWRVVEVWESKEEANKFFAEQVATTLRPGRRASRTFQELHTCVKIKKVKHVPGRSKTEVVS